MYRGHGPLVLSLQFLGIAECEEQASERVGARVGAKGGQSDINGGTVLRIGRELIAGRWIGQEPVLCVFESCG